MKKMMMVVMMMMMMMMIMMMIIMMKMMKMIKINLDLAGNTQGNFYYLHTIICFTLLV